MTAASDFRPLILERTQAWVDRHQARPGFPIVPPQIIEAQIDTESGGDPNAYNASSGATGLGQITEGGREWAVYKQDHPDAQFADVIRPEVNIDVMIAGLADRQVEGDLDRASGGTGATADWYMTAAAYLGGANLEGFNGAADSNGTDGGEYVRRIRNYIGRNWGVQTAEDIDGLQPGAARAKGGDWGEGTIFYDPKVPAVSAPDDLLDKVLKGFSDGVGGVIDAGKDAVSGAFGAVWGAIEDAAPRVGIGLLGAVILGIGLVVILRAPIGGAVRSFAGAKAKGAGA